MYYGAPLSLHLLLQKKLWPAQTGLVICTKIVNWLPGFLIASLKDGNWLARTSWYPKGVEKWAEDEKSLLHWGLERLLPSSRAFQTQNPGAQTEAGPASPVLGPNPASKEQMRWDNRYLEEDCKLWH